MAGMLSGGDPGKIGARAEPTPWTSISSAEWLREVERCLEAGRSVIVDDTNCFRFLRDNYRAIADRHGARTTVIHLDRPLELLRERIRENDQTRSRAPITEPVLLDLADKFEPLDADEHVIEFPPGISADAWVALRF